MQLEYKDAAAGRLISDEKTGIVEAFVSVTGVVDNVNDIIIPGAYEKTLAKRTPKGVWSHDWNLPIAKALDVKELKPGDPELPPTQANGQPWPTEAGAVYVKMQFNMDTQRGRDAFADVTFFGDQQEFSIGYAVPPNGATIDKKTGQRHIQQLEWFEFSPVLFGAASQARTKKDALAGITQLYTQQEVKEDGTIIQTSDLRSLLSDLKDLGVKVEFEDTNNEATNEATNKPEVSAAEEPPADKTGTTDDANPNTSSADAQENSTEQAESKADVATPGRPIPVEDPNSTTEETIEDLQEAGDAVAEVVREAPKEGVDPEVITAIKGLVEQLVAALNKLAPQVPEATEVKPVTTPVVVSAEKTAETTAPEHKSMRSILNDLIFNSQFDVNRLDTIDNGVRLLEKSMAERNDAAVAQNAQQVIDEIGFAAQAATDVVFQGKLQDLAEAVGNELKAYSEGEPVGDSEAKPVEEAEEKQPEAKVVLTAQELAEFKAFMAELDLEIS